MSTVGRWIHIAVTSNVKQLDLSFCPKNNIEDVEMPHCLVTSGSLDILKLYLGARRLRLPNITGFLAQPCSKWEDTEGNCPSGLSLISCFMNKLDLLYISCPKLESLRIENNKDEYSLKEAWIQPKMEGNTISVVGISSVEYLSINFNFFLESLGLITTMDAFTMDNFNQILKYCPKLESLRLNIDQDFHGKYAYLDDYETRRILTPDVK
ncbi:unnamed protein product [Lactuca saligna]|uniref:Uncharacterized protein n=1 Tax=Lactuca saligna TaxID=75948 RepID=A0AA35Z3J7_LACSI|nr:unnamed protein product [Lactuca saligna]